MRLKWTLPLQTSRLILQENLLYLVSLINFAKYELNWSAVKWFDKIGNHLPGEMSLEVLQEPIIYVSSLFGWKKLLDRLLLRLIFAGYWILMIMKSKHSNAVYLYANHSIHALTSYLPLFRIKSRSTNLKAKLCHAIVCTVYLTVT